MKKFKFLSYNNLMFCALEVQLLREGGPGSKLKRISMFIENHNFSLFGQQCIVWSWLLIEDVA